MLTRGPLALAPPASMDIFKPRPRPKPPPPNLWCAGEGQPPNRPGIPCPTLTPPAEGSCCPTAPCVGSSHCPGWPCCLAAGVRRSRSGKRKGICIFGSQGAPEGADGGKALRMVEIQEPPDEADSQHQQDGLLTPGRRGQRGAGTSLGPGSPEDTIWIVPDLCSTQPPLHQP